MDEVVLAGEMQRLATGLVEMGAKHSYRLNYSADSIDTVDRLIEDLFVDAPRQRPNPRFHRTIPPLVGAYVGEVLVRTLGGRWGFDPAYGEGVLLGCGMWVFPTHESRGRFIGGGEDILGLYYRAVSDMAAATSIDELARAVRRDWERQGLPPVAVDLTQIPAELRDRLPEDFLTFVIEAGLPEESDSKLIRFWSPNEWAESIDSAAATRDSYLIFADFLLDSHCYGLWLSGQQRGNVSLVFGDIPPPIGTFADFLRIYLADHLALHG